MTPPFAKLARHLANWREWELNPIVIKELRQGVRSWTVTGMLLFFLALLFLASLGFLVGQSIDGNVNLALGGRMFSVFVIILAAASVFFIPLYTGVRVAAERQDNNPDLLYVSTLSPARIILGKFLCSTYLVVLFFSACMPFMAFTNLLRGVDLLTVFFILAFLFLLVCASNSIAIFLACIPASRPFKVLFALAGFILSFWVVIPIWASLELMGAGVGAMMAQPNFWLGCLVAFGLGLAVMGLFFVLSVALISPPSANRARPVRIYFTWFWGFGGLVAWGWSWRTADPLWLWAWTGWTACLLALTLVATISNSDQLSLRVRRTIPPSSAKRLVAFFFFNGAAGGLLWVAGLFAATCFLSHALIATLPASALPTVDDWRKLGVTAVYAADYALTALLLQRRFLPRHPPKLAGLLAVLLAGGWAIAPSLFLFFANRLTWKSVEGLQLGNAFNAGFGRDHSELVAHQWFAGGWLLVALALNLTWFLRQVRNFRPPESPKAPPATGRGSP